MDFKSLLNQLDQLNEAEMRKISGKKYGGSLQEPDIDDEDEVKKEPEIKRGRGRPRKGSDETGQVKQYDFNPLAKAMGMTTKPPKTPSNKPVIKHKLSDKEPTSESMNSLKNYIKTIESKSITEEIAGQELTLKQMPGAAQLQDPASGKTLATGPADKIKALQGAVARGEVTLSPSMTKEDTLQEKEGEKWIQKAIKHPGAFSAKAKRAGKTVAAYAKEKEHAPGILGKQARLAKTLTKIAKSKEEMSEGDIPSVSGVDTRGAGLGVGRSDKVLEDKKKVNESRHRAARLLGKSHALAKEGYNCKFEDVNEMMEYHEGYKEGLDECYGQGVYEMAPATVAGMAHQAEKEIDEMARTEYMKHKAKTTPGDTFKAFGQTFPDEDVLESSAFAFESWDKQLNSLLTENEQVEEGMSVSLNKDRQGVPDSVTVSAEDDEAKNLLNLLKHAGFGLFDVEKDAPQDDAAMTSHDGISVVGDHDGMMSLIKKVTHDSRDDYRDEGDEESLQHEEMCNECGYMESKCECENEMLDEVESEDQMTYEVAEDSHSEQDMTEGSLEEDNQPDSDAAETTADEESEAKEDMALAVADDLKEWANDAGKKGTDTQFEQDIEFMTRVIAGGLNKPKSTGQTTIPVIAGQDTRTEDPYVWAKLAGIKK